MKDADFSDLLLIRKGEKDLTLGGGDSALAPVVSIGEWEARKEALKELYMLTLGQAPYHDIDPDLEIISEEDCGAYLRRKLMYNTGADERISAYMLLPKGLKGKVPAVLCIHPTTSMGKEQTIGNDPSSNGHDRAYALHLVEQGFITFAFDLMSAGERCFSGLKDFDTAPFYEKYPKWSSRGKDLWDVSQALDVVQSMPEVDAEKIGSIGHSQGGGITIHAMAVEPRIKAGVSSCGEWPMRISKNPFNAARTGWWVGRPLLRPFCVTGKEFPVQMHELLAMAAPNAIMNISALNDCKYTVEEKEFTGEAFRNMEENARKIYQLYGRPEAFKSITHLNGHSFLKEQRKAAYEFLKQHLFK
ncbi:MAG: hypothetical protein A2017_00560 [Lentisphaerae bacterium GWF2_44_16]|nr:MAG: hypothetical protein A2017_00560 [Lentisphaerae bacterium GWF2_44_16]